METNGRNIAISLDGGENIRFRDLMGNCPHDIVSRSGATAAVRVAGLVAVALLTGCMAGAPAGATDQAVQASSMDPDLVVRAVSGPPSATPWTTIEVRVEVCNQGGGWAPPSIVAVVTSDDSAIDGLDPLLATAQVWDLAPGGCRRVTAIGPSPGMFGRHVLGAITDRDQWVYEDDESNNAAAGSALLVGHDPDLVVERVRGPVTAAPGAQVSIDVRVCNRGQSWTPGAGVELYLSDDAAITSSDQPIGWIQTSDLAPGACDDRSALAPVWGPPGAHVLGAIVDPYQSIFELDEDNNARAGDALHIGWDPDLVITDIDGPPSAMPGSPVHVSVTVCNQGQSPSGYSQLEVHVSEDDALDPMLDPLVGNFPIPYLEPAQCTTARVPVSLYVGPEGAYRLGAIVDPWSSVPEIIEDNNQRLGDLIGVGYGPDLVVAGVTGPHSAWPGEGFQARARVCNQGQGPSSSTGVRMFVSPEGQDDGQYPSPPLAWVPWLAPGACASVTGPVFAPGEPGGYVLGAVVDPEGGPQGSVPELIESNNAGAGQRIAVGHDADLVVTAVTPPPGTLLAHGQAFVSARVCNHGRAPSGGAPVDLRVSRDAELSGDDMPVGYGPAPWLQPDACANVAMHAYFSVPEEGAYYLIAVVDPNDDVVEILDDNNTGASDRVGIGHSADLVVTSIVTPPSVLPGASFQVAVTVCNRGHTSSSFTEVEVTALGESAAAPAFEVFLGQVPIPYLPQGQCHTARMPASVYGPDGEYRLAAEVDRWDYVSEILEDNNDFRGGFLGVGHGPDLVVTGVSGPTSWWPYENFQATARVCNQGQGPSPGTSVRLFVAADGQSDGEPEGPSWPPGPPLAWVPWLAPGACASATGPVFAPGEPGGYVLGAVVDPEGGPQGWVSELIESNNTGTGQRIAIGHDADLVVTAVTPPPGTLLQYGQAIVSARVCNHGRVPSQGAPVELRVSRDAALSGDDMPAGQDHAPWLQPDTCANVPVHAQLSVPEEGAYYLIAVVDPYDSVIEILDDNNAGASERVGIGHSADLVVASIVAPPSALPGASIEVAVTVCNRGQMSSPFTEVEVKASVEPSSAPGYEVFLGQAPVPYMQPGQCHTVRMPAGVYGPPGVYRLAAVVDRWDSVSEILEDNNAFQGGVMGVGHDADLVVTAVSGPPSALPGAALDLTVRVCNQGQAPSWGAPIEVYLSADSEIGLPGDIFVGSAQADHLAPAACADVPVTAYAHFEPGAYVLGAIVDPHRWLTELIEDNNARAGDRIGIGFEADLVVAEVSGPPSAQPWTDFPVTARACNQGQGTSYDATLEVVLSADADVGDGAGDLLIGSVPVPMLAPGACHDVSTMAMAQVFSGVYTLGAVVRTTGASELIADNNGRAGGLLGVGHDPDLVVTAVTGPASAPVWGEILVTVEACNQGQGQAPGTALDVVLSSDASIDVGAAGDPPVGSAWIDPLAPGACQTLNVPAYPFQPEGSYVLGARVDPVGNVWELIESNNATAGGAIELTPY
jgi:subtilase family serine protease